MVELFIALACIIGLILGIMWMFLPWIMISKLDQVIDELKKINSSSTL